MTTLDDELRRRLSELEATLLPQVGGADLAVVQRRSRTRRIHRTLALAGAGALLVTAVVVGTRLHPFAQPGLIGPVAPSVPPPSSPPSGSTPRRAPQPVVLTDRGLAGIAAFGDPMDRVLAILRQRLGPPDQEVTNDHPEGNIHGVCPGGLNRYVRWGRLWVLFSAQSDYGQGRWHLFAYYVKGEQLGGRPEPATQRGIHLGSTVAELQAAYGRQVQIFRIEAPSVDGFRIGPTSGPAIDGWVDSTTADGRVTLLHGGQGCGE